MTDIGYETGLFWGLASGGERSGAAKRRHEEQGARQKPADRTRCGYRFWFAGAREWPNDRGSRGKAAGREMNGYVGLGAGGLATALDQPHVHHVANAGPALGVELIDSIDGYVLRPGRSLDFTRPAPNARISLSSRTAVRGLRRRGVRGSGRREENNRYQIHAEFSSLPPDHIRFIPISDSFQYPFRSTARFVPMPISFQCPFRSNTRFVPIPVSFQYPFRSNTRFVPISVSFHCPFRSNTRFVPIPVSFPLPVSFSVSFQRSRLGEDTIFLPGQVLQRIDRESGRTRSNRR